MYVAHVVGPEPFLWLANEYATSLWLRLSRRRIKCWFDGKKEWFVHVLNDTQSFVETIRNIVVHASIPTSTRIENDAVGVAVIGSLGGHD